MKKLIYLLSIFFNLSNITASPVIHIFGDSHAHNSFGSNENPRYFDAKDHVNYLYTYRNITFAIHWVGAKTLYRFGASGLDAMSIKDYGVQEGDVVVFAFGEIDIRCHIGKQVDLRKRSLDNVIDSLVTNYFNTINKNRAFFSTVHCMVMEIVPPTDLPKGHSHYNPSIPFYGTFQQRIAINRQLNARIYEACQEHNVIFLPTHNLYAQEDGSLNRSLSDVAVHIGFDHNYLLKDQLIELLIAMNLI